METYTEIKNRNIFVKYPRTDSATTDAYCAMADCRMIWGGNQTIAAMKAIPVKPRCVDINFADRYSLAIINGAAVLAADDIQRFRLAEAFYNDTYLMDQNACSSPQVILWEQDSLEAREKFWNAMLAQAKAKYHLQDATAVDKYTLMCRECIENKALKDIAHTGNLLYRIELNELPHDLVDHRGHGGFFYEYSLKNRKDFFARVTEQFQTITCFGIDPSELCQQVMQAHLTGIDRIVSIGQAMSIGAIWDGHDLLRELSRVIALD